MSKSYGNTISLRDDMQAIDEKLRKMPTDTNRVRLTDPGDPKKCPVWQLHEVYSADDVKEWVQEGCKTAGIGCLECKRPIIDAVQNELKPIQERAKEFSKNRDLVRNIVAEGREFASDLASDTLDEVRQAIGIQYR
jgi:tryptophanyl-tRNA synthetase